MIVSNLCGEVVVSRIAMAHRLMLKAVEPLTEEEFVQPPSASAPPIGWHVWHTARWADRVQASLPRSSDADAAEPQPANDIWTNEKLAGVWQVDAASRQNVQHTPPRQRQSAAAAA